MADTTKAAHIYLVNVTYSSFYSKHVPVKFLLGNTSRHRCIHALPRETAIFSKINTSIFCRYNPQGPLFQTIPA